jgi:hypothetical protein
MTRATNASRGSETCGCWPAKFCPRVPDQQIAWRQLREGTNELRCTCDHSFDAVARFYGEDLGFAIADEWDRANGRGRQRAADVTLKERRRLVLLVRETPLHLGHLRLLVQVAELGAMVAPPVPAFYHRPATLQAVVDQTVNRTCDLLGIELSKDLFPRWQGPAAHLPAHTGQGNGQAPPVDDRAIHPAV